MKTKVYMLPAFDGTGLMFQPLIDALGDGFECVALPYPQTGAQDYTTLAAHLYKLLPKQGDYVLLGESFAGPLVYQLAMASARDHGACRQAVFIATYLDNPNPFLLKLLHALPVTVIKWLVTNPRVVQLLTLSGQADEHVARAIAANFAQVPGDVIKQRLDTLNTLHGLPEGSLTLPSYYLQASVDHLVSAKRQQDFIAKCESLKCLSIKGGHFIAQENPSAVASRLCGLLNLNQNALGPEALHG